MQNNSMEIPLMLSCLDLIFVDDPRELISFLPTRERTI